MTDEELRRLAEKAIESHQGTSCQPWRAWDDYRTAASPQTILSLLDRLKAAEANARTPGTVEVCKAYRDPDCGHYPGADGCIQQYNCPLRTKDTP